MSRKSAKPCDGIPYASRVFFCTTSTVTEELRLLQRCRFGRYPMDPTASQIGVVLIESTEKAIASFSRRRKGFSGSKQCLLDPSLGQAQTTLSRREWQTLTTIQSRTLFLRTIRLLVFRKLPTYLLELPLSCTFLHSTTLCCDTAVRSASCLWARMTVCEV